MYGIVGIFNLNEDTVDESTYESLCLNKIAHQKDQTVKVFSLKVVSVLARKRLSNY